MAVSRRDPFRHPRQQDIRVTPRRDTTAHSLARDIRPDRVTLRRDTARSLAQDIRLDRVIPCRDTVHSPARDIRPDQVTMVARAERQVVHGARSPTDRTSRRRIVRLRLQA